MKIAIVGSGNVGGALGTRLLEAGHDVRFAVRAADSELSARFGEARVKPLAEAVSDAEVVFLAVPGGVVVEAAKSLRSTGRSSWTARTRSVGTPARCGRHPQRARTPRRWRRRSRTRTW